jgi:hypothetical protein
MLLRLTCPSSHEKKIEFRKSANEDTVQCTGNMTEQEVSVHFCWESNRGVLTHLFSFSLESEVRCSDNDRQLGMTESSSCSLSSRVCQHAMDAPHRKCNREHQGIPEAPQARCSAAGPLPSQPVGKLATTTTFWRRGMCLVHLGNSATLHLSVLYAYAVRAVLPFPATESGDTIFSFLCTPTQF